MHYIPYFVESISKQMTHILNDIETSSSPLRIAYFAEIFPSKSETWVHHEIAALQSLGCIVHVFATHPKPQNIPSELTHFCDLTTYLPEIHTDKYTCIKTLGKHRWLQPVFKGFISDCPSLRHKSQVIRDLFYAIRFAPDVLHFKPDLLFAHFAASRANIALFLSLISRIPFAIKMHAVDIFNRVALFRLKTTKAARVLTISDYNINFIGSHYPDINIAHFKRHACGIPLNEYQFQPIKSVVGVPIILAVGRLVRMKGFDILLQASHILINQGFQHRIIILGDGPEMAPLERLCSKLDLAKVVELRGYTRPNEVNTLLRTAALFVLPSVWDPVAGTQDGIPVALMEAMALGVPVVSTLTSGIPELIQDDVNGLLAIPNDEESLALRIKYGCEMGSAARIEMLNMARQKIEADHDIEKLTEILLETFRDFVCKE